MSSSNARNYPLGVALIIAGFLCLTACLQVFQNTPNNNKDQKNLLFENKCLKTVEHHEDECLPFLEGQIEKAEFRINWKPVNLAIITAGSVFILFIGIFLIYRKFGHFAILSPIIFGFIVFIAGMLIQFIYFPQAKPYYDTCNADCLIAFEKESGECDNICGYVRGEEQAQDVPERTEK